MAASKSRTYILAKSVIFAKDSGFVVLVATRGGSWLDRDSRQGRVDERVGCGKYDGSGRVVVVVVVFLSRGDHPSSL